MHLSGLPRRHGDDAERSAPAPAPAAAALSPLPVGASAPEGVLILPLGERVPVRIHDRGHSIVLIPLAAVRACTPSRRLDDAVLEFACNRGAVILRGGVSLAAPRLIIFRPRTREVTQRRKHVRVPLMLPVALARAGGGPSWESTTIDLSGGGMLVGGVPELEVGEEVVFSLALEQRGPPVCGTARVLLARRGHARAMQFDRLDDDERERIIRVVFERLRVARATVRD